MTKITAVILVLIVVLAGSWVWFRHSNGTGEVVQSLKGDATPPKISMTAPDGAVVSGPWVVLSATSTDNVGVVGVEFKYKFADSDSFTTLADVTAPLGITYSTTWDTTSLKNSAHYKLYAVARDAAGNHATSTMVSVQIDGGNYTPGAFGDTPLTRTTQFIRPKDGVQMMVFRAFAYPSAVNDYLPYITKEFDYVWFSQNSLESYEGVLSVKGTTNDVGPYSLLNLFKTVAIIKSSTPNPNLKVGIYYGGGDHLAPWHPSYAALSDVDFIHDLSGNVLRWSKQNGAARFVNIASATTRQKLTTFWVHTFSQNPALDGILIDSYKSDYADKNIPIDGCREGACNVESFFANGLKMLSSSLVAALPGHDVIYNAIAHVSDLPREGQQGLYNSGWIQSNGGADEEWAHEIYTSPEVFKNYLEINASITAQGKKIFFWVQARHLKGVSNNLALEQFYLASYLLMEQNPLTYFDYNPGTVYIGTHGIYYYANWNYDYGAPVSAYATTTGGLYSRTFAHGIAVVNPTSAPLAFTLPIENQYHVWDPAEGTLVSGTVTIPAKTGVFYFR